MARQYAPLFTSIWNDRDFTSLPSDAQRVYMLAMSQPNVSYAGVVPFTEKRWATLAPDTTPGYIADAINVLEDRGYVVLDPETEELWVRSFIKANKILAQPQLKKSLIDAVEDIHSPTIRASVVATLPDDLKVQVGTPVAGCAEPCPPPSPGGSDTGQGLDLDPHLNTDREGDPAVEPATTGHVLLAPSSPPHFIAEVEDHLAVLADLHGTDKVERVVQQLVGDRRRFPRPSDARKVLDGLLGPAPADAKPNVLDEYQRAQMETAAGGLERVREVLADVDTDPEAIAKAHDTIAQTRAALRGAEREEKVNG